MQFHKPTTANSVVTKKATNWQKPLATPIVEEAWLATPLLPLACVILGIKIPQRVFVCSTHMIKTHIKPSSSKLDESSLLPEAELRPNVVTTTVCNTFCSAGAAQLNPHDGACVFAKPSTACGVELSTATAYFPDLSDCAVIMKTALPVSIFEHVIHWILSRRNQQD